jgi:mannose-1-phosphate guanylyltransferase/mannose-6-phosphate isomerase
MKVVIRAGGQGLRLWPMSRQAWPKQFQRVVGDTTMLRATWERVRQAVEATDIFVSVSRDLVAKLQEELPELLPSNIIAESSARNTGPAMCLEVAWLKQLFGDEEIIASIPADDYISDATAFHDLLKLSAGFIKDNPEHILTPAVRPEVVDTGYSYFKTGAGLAEAGEEAIYAVAEVIEKPEADYCQALIDSGDYYCHTGMYIWQLGNISRLFSQLQAEMWATCQQVAKLINSDELAQAARLYDALAKMSIESAITDKAPQVAMSVSSALGWSDLGKWHIIKKILSEEGHNLTKGEVIVNDSRNNLIYNMSDKRVVVVNDVSDLVIVDTGDTVFVSSLKNSAEVKKCLDKLREAGKEEYL